jgi:pilus assembly protein CpaE
MHNEVLTVSVLQGTANSKSQLVDILADCPRLRILHQAADPDELLRQSQNTQPDLVIVDLKNGHMPEWLGDLTHRLPQTAVMVCSENREPDFLIRVIQLGVREFVPMPLLRSDLEAALERVWTTRKRRSGAPEASQGRILAVTGLKGGMGATSVAVNLAVTLAEKHPDRVVLVDLGRPFPDVGKFLDLAQESTLSDLTAQMDLLDAGFVKKTLSPHNARLSVLPGCANFTEWQAVDLRVLKKLWAILRSTFDWIVIDLGHWLDDLYLQTVQEADQVLVLVDLMVPNIKNLKSLWETLQGHNLTSKKVKFVVNRYHKMDGGDLTLEGLKRIQQQPVFFTLPSDEQALNESINHGMPLQDVAPRSKLCRSLRQMTEELVAACHSESMGKEAVQPKTRRRFLFF